MMIHVLMAFQCAVGMPPFVETGMTDSSSSSKNNNDTHKIRFPEYISEPVRRLIQILFSSINMSVNKHKQDHDPDDVFLKITDLFHEVYNHRNDNTMLAYTHTHTYNIRIYTHT